MSMNKIYNTFTNIFKYNKNKEYIYNNNKYKYNNYKIRYIFYDIEQNKSSYICNICKGYKIIKCLDCNEDKNIYKKTYSCTKCVNGEIKCDLCDYKGLKYYFSV